MYEFGYFVKKKQRASWKRILLSTRRQHLSPTCGDHKSWPHLSVADTFSGLSTESFGAFSATRRARGSGPHLPASLPRPATSGRRQERDPPPDRPPATAAEDDARSYGRDRRGDPARAGPAHGAAGVARVPRPRRRRDARRSLLVLVLDAASPPPAPPPRCVACAELRGTYRPLGRVRAARRNASPR